MNKIYKIVWNKALGQMVVVSENAKSAAKGTTVGTHLSRPLHKTQNISACPQWLLCSLSLSMALVANATWAGVANTALPTGANITQGSAQISQNNNSLNINQNSQNLSTNWNSFNIGKDATVNFNQPNQSAIAVNRVLDNNASQIMGKLNANGQVFLLNPNGVIFSKTAQVNVGGLVASTLNLSDSDIAQGKFTLKNNGNAGSVENYGSIIANGGVVALIAPTVKNYGTIQAHNGTVHLTAADQVTLQLQDGSLVEYQIDLGTLQGLVENGGAIQADNGAVYLTAQAKNSLSKAVVNHTGIIEANRLEKNAKGEIILLGDMQNGETNVSGTLKAEGKNGQDGGFIETSAANVQIAGSTKVSTLSDSGKTGEWLIDPFNVTISNQAQAGNNNVANTFTPSQNDSIINVGTLNSALASNNITVTTAGAGTQAGNINVNADVTWSANTALTLRADNDIHINANITATNNNGKLNLQYGQTTSNSNANYYLNNGAKVNLKAGQNFSTQKGANAPINYTVITDLGAAGSTTRTDLQGMSGDLLWNYVLGADINAATTSGWNAGLGFNPIGTWGNEFKGKFDGLNHTISNLTINRPNQSFVGLFGATSNATIQNIGLIQANIKGFWRVGALIGEANSTNTSNAFSTGQVNGDAVVGGLVGRNQNQSSILASYSNAQVTATNDFAGGLSGANAFSSRIENSYATGDVTAQGTNSHAGGLSGNNYGNSTILNSYATGKVTGVDIAGGLLGNNDSSTVENSYATGQVSISTGTEQGGLVGWYGGTIKNSYWNSATTGQTQAVGDNSGNLTNVLGLTTAQMFDKNSLSGFDFDIIWGNGDNQTTPYLKNHIGSNNVINKNDTVAGASYAVIQTLNQLQGMSGNLSGKYVLGADIDATATSGWNNGQGFDPIGNSSNRFTGKFDGLNHTISNLNINRPNQNDVGLFGLTNNATIQNIGLIQANIKGFWRVGALIGEANSTNTSNAFSTGQVNGDAVVGGLVGVNRNQSSILSSYSNAQVTATNIFAGGLSGANENSSRIENSYATGAVQTQAQGYNSNAGGLSGINNSNSVIKNSYATGAVSGIENVGGLLGQNYSGTVENSYATGQVTRTSGSAITFGGLVGWYGGTIKNSYWNSATTGQTQAVGDNSGNLTNVLGLTTAQMFDKNILSGFDFDIIWGNGDNQTTPYLKNHIGLNNVINKNDTVAGASYAVIQTLNQLQGMSGNLSGKYVLGADIDATATSGWNAGQGFSPIGTQGNEFKGKFDGLNHTISNLTINRQSQDYVGLFGATNNSTIQNIGLIQANIKGSLGVGALIGRAEYTNTSNAFSTGQVNGDAVVGGLVGVNRNQSSILSSYSNAQVTATTTFAGGLSGTNVFSSRIENSYATGAVQAQGSNSNAGGLSGNNVSNSVIKNSYATGAVSGIERVGGLLGNNDSSTVENSYATGQVSISTGTEQGGLVGWYGGTIKNSYWNKDTTGQGAAVGDATGTLTQVQGLTTAQMKQGANFAFINADSYLGGKNTVWRIYEGNAAPLLRSFLTQATLDSLANQNKTYNGQTQGVDLSSISLAGLDNSKIFAGQSSSKNVGTYNVGYYSNQQGYDFIGGSASLTINKADLAITGLSAGNKVYDATTVATLTGTASVSPLGSDSVTLGGTGTGTFADKNVGNAKAVTVSGFTLGGTDAGNYNLVQPTGLTATISQRTLNATLTAQNKIYDGNNSASVSYGDDRIGQDVLVVSGTATFNDKNAATGKTVTANGLALTGTDAGNYELASTTATTQADIDKATLTATITAQNKIYDGNNSASVSYGDDRIGQDVLVVSGTATFSDKNAATGKTVTATGLALTGTDAGNYELASTTATDTADISKAQAIVTANSLNTMYNGQNQTASGFSATGLVNGEDSSVLTGVTASVTAKDAGSYTNKANGVDKNYDLTFVDGALEIAKAKATVTANSLNTVYNGKDQTVTGFTASGLVNGETEAVLSGVTATVTGKNAGSYINTATGTDGNYDITFVDGALEIAKAKATITANSLNTVYNGQNQTASGFSATGLVNGEDSSVLTGVTASVTAKDAGSYTNKANGVDKNYDLTFVDGALEIAKAKATITANSLNTVYNGQNQTASGFSATGLVNGEDSSVLTGVTASVTAKDAGSYTNKANGVDKNYDLTFVDGALEIAKAKATVTANSLNTVYNGKDQTVTGFTASGLVAGEDEAVLSNVSASVTAQEVGNYANKATGSDDNYELTFVDGVLSIQAKPIVPVPPQPPVVPSYYPIWGNPYQRAIRTQSVQQKTKAFDIVEIEIEGNGINMDNIQTLGSN